MSFLASQRATKRAFLAASSSFCRISLFDLVDLVFLLFFFEVFVVPEVSFIEDALGRIARVEDGLVNPRFEVGLTQVRASGLQRIKKEAGGLVLDLAGEQQAHDLHERHLDGVGVFEHRQEERGRAATAAIDVQTDALVLVALVEVAEPVAAQRGRSALRAVGFQVLTAIWITGHVLSLLPSPLVLWNQGVGGNSRINLWAAMS